MRIIAKALVIAGITTFAGLTGSAIAADAPVHTFTSNVSLVSDYYFRGLSQTWHAPALQGGVDYAHANGWYAGLWASNISGNQYAGGSLEVDYYGGYNGKFNDDWGWTAGVYGYYYPGANANKIAGSTVNQSYNTLEWNAGVSYKWVSFKVSTTFGDAFGASKANGYTSDTSGSTYMDLTANIPLADDLTLGLHVGQTDVKANLSAPLASGATNPDYTDYKIGLTKTFNGGWNIGLAYAESSNSKYYNGTTSLNNASEKRDLGEGTFILSAGRSF